MPINTLSELHADIDMRVEIIRKDHPDWLCCRGCDNCCRRLAEIPQLTALEWDWLREGLTELPWEQRRRIRQDLIALTKQVTRPIICPFLDQSAGICLVYVHRPIACRTYGFYVQRDKGLYCKDIESQVAGDKLTEVVWGNQDAIDQRLKCLGESRELTAWYADWKDSG